MRHPETSFVDLPRHRPAPRPSRQADAEDVALSGVEAQERQARAVREPGGIGVVAVLAGARCKGPRAARPGVHGPDPSVITVDCLSTVPAPARDRDTHRQLPVTPGQGGLSRRGRQQQERDCQNARAINLGPAEVEAAEVAELDTPSRAWIAAIGKDVVAAWLTVTVMVEPVALRELRRSDRWPHGPGVGARTPRTSPFACAYVRSSASLAYCSFWRVGVAS